MGLLPTPAEEPEPAPPLDPTATADFADVELLELNMLQHLVEVTEAWSEVGWRVEALLAMPNSALAGIDAYDRFVSIEGAAELLALAAHEGRARWHRWFHGKDSDL